MLRSDNTLQLSFFILSLSLSFYYMSLVISVVRTLAPSFSMCDCSNHRCLLLQNCSRKRVLKVNQKKYEKQKEKKKKREREREHTFWTIPLLLIHHEIDKRRSSTLREIVIQFGEDACNVHKNCSFLKNFAKNAMDERKGEKREGEKDKEKKN